MEISKRRPVSNTVMFSSIFFSVAVCFVALIHVEIELHTHRQMLQALNQQREENVEQRNPMHEQTPTGSDFKMLESLDSAREGELLNKKSDREQDATIGLWCSHSPHILKSLEYFH